MATMHLALRGVFGKGEKKGKLSAIWDNVQDERSEKDHET